LHEESLSFNFQSQDIGSIVCLEHINLAQPDQMTAMVFYVEGLGLTRDPYAPENTSTMWINIGNQQIHVPKYPTPQIMAGHIGIITPSIPSLLQRLQRIQDHELMKGTKFSWTAKDKFKKDLVPPGYNNKVVHVTCPYGNKFRIYEHSKDIGHHQLSVYYVLHYISSKHSKTVGQFYQKYFDVPVTFVPSEKTVHITVGPWQRLIFVENEKWSNADYTNYHVAFYVSGFAQTYKKFHADNLLFTQHRFADRCETLENALSWKQFRTKNILDENKEVLISFEHEVRSLHHPSFKRPLVNRLGNTGIYCSQ